MGEQRWRRVGAATMLAIGAVTAFAGTASAGVGPSGELQVSISVDGLAAQDVLDGLTIEVWAETALDTFTLVDPVDCTPYSPDATGAPWSVSSDFDCTFTPPGVTSFAIGLVGVPDHWQVGGSCTSPLEPPQEQLDLGGGELFSYYGFDPAECTLFVSTSVLLIDKVVVGGEASSADFEIEVLDDQGDPVTSGSDVADATCEADYDLTKCGAVVVPPGTGFQIGEASVENYELTSVECDEFINASNPPSSGVAPIGEDGFRTDDGDTYCVVTNTYVPPATTTTTTTTTTTLPAVTTTSIDAGVVTLPPTGASASSNTAIAAMAGLLVLLGGAMLAVRRRSV